MANNAPMEFANVWVALCGCVTSIDELETILMGKECLINFHCSGVVTQRVN
jgi:hypothetical protein